MKVTRRGFLQSAAATGVGLALATPAEAWQRRPPLVRLQRFTDLPRHFVFEYYPWYAMSPVRHWDEGGRRPPLDLASNYVPLLGAYDSSDTRVLEQHARWIAESGAGAINMSWWGPGSETDDIVPAVMDVMAAHDIRVTFHIEPYSALHGLDYARDIEYLITEYGDRRHWDCFLQLQDANGSSGPVFKSFRTILPSTMIDCHGARIGVDDYTADAVWREQTDRVRHTFRRDFDHVTLLADSLDAARTRASGFDGIAVYDNYVRPATWQLHAEECTRRDLLFSFNINPGFDAIFPRQLPAGSCKIPFPLEPAAATAPDWDSTADRRRADEASAGRIDDSFQMTVELQTDRDLFNARRGFFLTYICSFNEWHEGHQFEPMKNRGALTPEERALGYHNPDEGGYRLARLAELLKRARSTTAVP